MDLGFKVVKPTGTEDFFEDFESYGQGQVAPFGPWKVLEESPHVEEGVQPDKTIGKILRVEGNQGIFTPGEWTNFILECNLRLNGILADGIVLFRLSDDAKKGFYVNINLFGASLHKFAGSIDMKIAENTSVKASEDVWHYLKLVVNGQNIKVYLDGKKIIDVQDPDVFPGGIGFARAEDTAFYDNVRVETLIE
ncbi:MULTISPECIES: DUF1080 domain-containing protein [Thermotoga]|uniref:3-keto-disaccharide hydrolase n=1 Tax=Thermotoga TaxID=2335 RepID=UPI001EF12732|nr:MULTISPECIES: DUF1080 domain-containing protein [Thermotoga]